ncbi:hypothetical protein Mapa_005040 [Marchantia paleacea]|nr:hypothetical protein Mapa_005040 [Marchantia paleacea]
MKHRSLLLCPIDLLLALSIVLRASGRGLTDVSGRTLLGLANTSKCRKYPVLECGCTNNTQRYALLYTAWL